MSMNVFDLDRSVLDTYKRFARSFTDVRAPDLMEQIEAAYGRGAFWPEPMVQLNPNFKSGHTVRELVEAGELAPGCEKIFRDPNSKDGSLSLRRHQVEAVGFAPFKSAPVNKHIGPSCHPSILASPFARHCRLHFARQPCSAAG
jgi:hypothetical protein